MKRKYQGVIVLKMQGQEEGLEDTAKNIGKELEGEGAVMEQIDQLGRREFAYRNHSKQTHGYYVHYQFEAEPSAIDKMRIRLALNKDIQLQNYRLR